MDRTGRRIDGLCRTYVKSRTLKYMYISFSLAWYRSKKRKKNETPWVGTHTSQSPQPADAQSPCWYSPPSQDPTTKSKPPLLPKAYFSHRIESSQPARNSSTSTSIPPTSPKGVLGGGASKLPKLTISPQTDPPQDNSLQPYAPILPRWDRPGRPRYPKSKTKTRPGAHRIELAARRHRWRGEAGSWSCAARLAG